MEKCASEREQLSQNAKRAVPVVRNGANILGMGNRLCFSSASNRKQQATNLRFDSWHALSLSRSFIRSLSLAVPLYLWGRFSHSVPLRGFFPLLQQCVFPSVRVLVLVSVYLLLVCFRWCIVFSFDDRDFSPKQVTKIVVFRVLILDFVVVFKVPNSRKK